MDILEPLDPEYVRERLSKPPFILVDGVENVRDLGSYPTKYPGMVTKPNLLYRSAEVSTITEEGDYSRFYASILDLLAMASRENFTTFLHAKHPSTGKQKLRDLGVTTVYDLRSDTEIKKYNTPCPTIDGIEVVRVPVFKLEDYSPEMMAKRFELYASGKTEAFMELYSQILEHGGPAFGTILRHIRDHPEEACVFHCTAGKDRTGVIAALLLKLAGVDDDAIAEDYSLTRIGREPAREKVMARLAKMPFFASDNEKALNMLTSRKEVMIAFLKYIDDHYGGVEGYLKQYVQLTDDDITTIRHNILAPHSRQ